MAPRILQEVPDHPTQQAWIAANRDRLTIERRLVVARAFLGREREEIDLLVPVPRFGRIQATGGQDLVDQRVELGDVLLELALALGVDVLLHQLHRHADAGERSAQLVRRIGEERFVGGDQLFDALCGAVEAPGEPRYLGTKIRREALQRRLLLGLRRRRRWQDVLGERARHLERVTGGASVAELAPEEARHERERRQTREHREIHTQIESSHQSCCRANTYPAPRTVRMRRGFFGSSSIAARMRETCTSIERSKASSASPLTRSIKASRVSTRPAFSASARSKVNWWPVMTRSAPSTRTTRASRSISS